MSAILAPNVLTTLYPEYYNTLGDKFPIHDYDVYRIKVLHVFILSVEDYPARIFTPYGDTVQYIWIPYYRQ